MQFRWSTLIATIGFVQLIECGVVMRKRPFPYHERSNAKTTTATTTTTTEETIYEESGGGGGGDDDDGVADRLAHMTLPSNATSIRSDITDNFSCEGRIYGYYADVENDCQIFHVCLPVTYPDGKETQFRWSFICPEETTFNQEAFTCVRTDELNFECAESERFYELNRILGFKDETVVEEVSNNDIYHSTGKITNKYGDNNRRYGSPAEPVQQQQNQHHTTAAANYRSPVASHASTAAINGFYGATSGDSIYPMTADTKTLPSEQQPTVESTAATMPIPLATDESTTSAEPSTVADFEAERSPEPLYTRFPVRGAYTTARSELNTRIVPELYENGLGESAESAEDQSKAADEVVDSIKHLQSVLPAIDDDELRSKRVLHQNDSIKSRYNLFDALNNH